MNAYKADPSGHSLVTVFTGFNPSDGSWHPSQAYGLMALIAGAAISMVGSKLRLNRYIPKPFAI